MSADGQAFETAMAGASVVSGVSAAHTMISPPAAGAAESVFPTLVPAPVSVALATLTVYDKAHFSHSVENAVRSMNEHNMGWNEADRGKMSASTGGGDVRVYDFSPADYARISANAYDGGRELPGNVRLMDTRGGYRNIRCSYYEVTDSKGGKFYVMAVRGTDNQQLAEQAVEIAGMGGVIPADTVTWLRETKDYFEQKHGTETSVATGHSMGGKAVEGLVSEPGSKMYGVTINAWQNKQSDRITAFRTDGDVAGLHTDRKIPRPTHWWKASILGHELKTKVDPDVIGFTVRQVKGVGQNLARTRDYVVDTASELVDRVDEVIGARETMGKVVDTSERVFETVTQPIVASPFVHAVGRKLDNAVEQSVKQPLRVPAQKLQAEVDKNAKAPVRQAKADLAKSRDKVNASVNANVVNPLKTQGGVVSERVKSSIKTNVVMPAKEEGRILSANFKQARTDVLKGRDRVFEDVRDAGRDFDEGVRGGLKEFGTSLQHQFESMPAAQFDMPMQVEVPQIEVPQIEVPQFEVPQFEMPQFENPW